MIERSKLVALACGDLPEPAATEVEEHLLSCDECTRVAEQLDAIVREVAALAAAGAARAVVTGATLERLRSAGVPHGEYELGPGESVMCRIAPGDLLNVVTLHADLTNVERLAVVVRTQDGRILDRLEDVPFDAHRGRVVTVEPGERLRQLPTMRVELVLYATTAGGRDRLLGEYALDHQAS